MNYNSSNFNELEKIIMEKLLEGENPDLEILREQYNGVVSVKREFTGHGFFTDFTLPNSIQKTSVEKFVIDDVILNGQDKNGGLSFILFVEDGKINLLEGFVYGNEIWPDSIEIRQLDYMYPDKKRNLTELVKSWE